MDCRSILKKRENSILSTMKYLKQQITFSWQSLRRLKKWQRKHNQQATHKSGGHDKNVPVPGICTTHTKGITRKSVYRLCYISVTEDGKEECTLPRIPQNAPLNHLHDI